MVCGGITKDGMSKCKVDPCGVYSLIVKASSVLCLLCGKWIHDRCAGVKKLTSKFQRKFTCIGCDGNIGEVVEQEVKLCNKVETVSELTCLGDRMSAGERCEAAVTARTRCGSVRFRECGELLHGRIFPLRLNGAVYESYIRPAILFGSEAWCLKEREMKILRRTDRSMVRAICGVQLKDKKIYRFDVHAGFEETMDQLTMTDGIVMC